jgi:hypothetical protein
MIKLEIAVPDAGAKEFPDVHQAIFQALAAMGLPCRFEATVGDDI